MQTWPECPGESQRKAQSPASSLRQWTLGVATATVSLFLAMGCSESGTPKTSDDPDVVAAYRGGEITREEFDAYEPPPIDDDPQVAEAREEDWRVVKMQELVFRKILSESGEVPEAVVTRAALGPVGEILTNAMLWELGWNQIPVSMEEIRTEYDANPETYVEIEKLQTQYIFFRAETEEMSVEERAEVYARAAEVREEVLSGADFAEIARQVSESSTGRTGGFYTVTADHDVFPTFFHGIKNLKVGEISEVIDTPTGFHVVKLLAKIPPFVREFDTQIEHARKTIQAARLLELRAEFVEEYGPKFGLGRNYEALDDPFTPADTKLIWTDDWSYTFRHLSVELGDHYVVHLYNAYFPRVHAHLDEVTTNAILYREALSRGVDKRESIAAQIEEVTRQARYRLELNRRAKEYVANLPEENIREFFDQNAQRFKTLRTFDLDVILLKQREDEEALWQTFKRAEGLVERLRAGEDFATLAREHSHHFSASDGGRLQTLTSYGIAYQLQPKPAYTGLVNKLEVGEVSVPMVADAYDPKRLIYIQTGVIITKLVGVTEPRQRTYEESREKVAESYQRRNSQEILANIKASVLEAADLQIYFGHLPAL